MAIAAAMNNQEDCNCKHDEHEHDVIMPGFRFHPTEEELVQFYLRRKVEGKRFNLELITFLDLYRYDPWELPALAAIGEKEWYFYVPRDRKYRSGDRPNRVTTSGYWKATGADRTIRSEIFESIGLKKTLVFYSGKAPKGLRTSWIMNEYRLPQNDTQRLQKAEISLCRVYKRAGVKDHPSLPRCLPAKAAASSPSSSRGSKHVKKQQDASTPASRGLLFQPSYGGSTAAEGNISETSTSSSTDITTSLVLSHRSSFSTNPLAAIVAARDDHHRLHPTFMQSSSDAIDDLHKLVHNYSSQQSASIRHETHHHYNPIHTPNLLSHFPVLQPQARTALNVAAAAAYSDRLWEWNAIPETSKDYNNLFK